MANYNEHKCLACGQIFDYCRRCAVTPIVYKAEGFCSEKCSHVFNALSKHGCNLATAEETLAELGNIEGIAFVASIQSHIDAINREINPVKASTPEKEEDIIEESKTEESVQYSKKKRW